MALPICDVERNDLAATLDRSFGRLFPQVEAYPELKASDNISMLQSSLNEIEAQLAAARRTYNSAVTDFNNAIQMFPGCLFASMARFQKRDLFEIPEAERQNVDVNELFKR